MISIRIFRNFQKQKEITKPNRNVIEFWSISLGLAFGAKFAHADSNPKRSDFFNKKNKGPFRARGTGLRRYMRALLRYVVAEGGEDHVVSGLRRQTGRRTAVVS